MKHYMIGLIAVGFFLTSCQKDAPVIPDFYASMIELGTQQLPDGKSVTLYSHDSLTTGYNEIFIQILDNKKPVTSAAVSFTTLMDMGSMKHSSPSVPPVFVSQRNGYEAAAVFTMPASNKEWSMIVQVDGQQVEYKVNVAAAAGKTSASFKGTDGKSYVIALFPNKKWRVGLNEFSVMISQKEDMMTFLPVAGLSISFRPEMTSMGHGSPNNIDPIDAGHGFYNGTANFTMTGDWRLHFKIEKANAVLIDAVSLDIVF